jgi:hypothetical protein
MSWLASAAEAKTGAAFINGQEGCSLRTTLIELGHPQPTSHSHSSGQCLCVEGIINATVKQCHSKAIDTRFYCLHDGIAQGQFSIHWKSGATNLANYFTKHHAPAHHQQVRPVYVHESDYSTGSGHLPDNAHMGPTQPTLSTVRVCRITT